MTRTVEDVIPPDSPVIKENDITNAVKQIAGTSSENGAQIFVKINGQWLKDSSNNIKGTIVSGGVWSLELPFYIDKNDKIEVFAKDNYSLLNQSYIDGYTKKVDGEGNPVLNEYGDQIMEPIIKQGIKNPPTTATKEPNNAEGNINIDYYANTTAPAPSGYTGYDNYTGYHDAIKSSTKDERFDPAAHAVTKDVLTDLPNVKKEMSSNQ